ncbi:MAG: hypothetical protein ACKOEX_14345 [Planctomycetia bacterium]
MKDVRVWMAVALFMVTGWLISPFVFPPRPPEVSAGSIPEIRYVCRKSGEVFTLPLAGDVLDNPKTGEPTLVPAVYDARRKRWRPGPPLDVMRQKGMLKPAT